MSADSRGDGDLGREAITPKPYGPSQAARDAAYVAYHKSGEKLNVSLDAAHDPALGDGMSVNLGAALDEVWNATGGAGLSENQRHHIVAEVRRRVLRG